MTWAELVFLSLFACATPRQLASYAARERRCKGNARPGPLLFGLRSRLRPSELDFTAGQTDMTLARFVAQLPIRFISADSLHGGMPEMQQ
jgi:hypothetical protein